MMSMKLFDPKTDRILHVYFNGGGVMHITMPTDEAIAVAEQWGDWIKAGSKSDPVPIAGGLGWGFLFTDVCGVHATEVAEDEIDELQRELAIKQLKKQRDEMDMLGGSDE